ncbi:ribonuclease P/MRP protein subunit POP5 [Podospora aff. communis PSN243]|uniref:Ribonuclease P/MRP protein subunit POP5 n=1 Tax=Podospora aff. communis PSN243 TaxID=3040156 RepID=A0AAV9GL32_9PEZI|nr:ribonuclease P/MRP protein subunit POP5 [Podospora aff. communis PSN243]
MVRMKDRYLLVNIVYTDVLHGQAKGPVSDLMLYNQPTVGELKPRHLLEAIRGEVNALFGDCGSGAVERSLQVKYLSQATSTFILRISRDHYRLVWAALSFMNKLPFKDGRPCVYRVMRVSGTIRKAEEEAVRRAKLFILAAKEEMAGKQTSSALHALLRGRDQGSSLAMPVDQDVDELDDDDSGMEVDG